MGKRVKYLLNKKYKIKEIAVVDNKLCKKCDDILSIYDLEKIKDEDYVVLFAATNPEIYSDLLAEAQLFHGRLVCNIAELNSSCIGKMEMHPFPQKKIFEIAYANACIPMEVYQDGLSGQDDFSCTFVMKKI